MNKEIIQLFSRPLPSTRSGAFYNTFPYPTKISPESIAIYIATITKPNDVILDTFGGSGSTAIAALLCEQPTEQMKKIAAELSVTPTWGKRNAVIYEIGTYGSFATQTLSSRIKASEFKKAVDSFVREAENELSKYYYAKDNEGKVGTIRYVIWSDVLSCSACNAEISYFSEGTSRSPVKFDKEITCPICRTLNEVDSMNHVTEAHEDRLLGKTVIRKKRIPAWIYGTTDGVNWDREANSDDIKNITAIENEPFDVSDYPKEIVWGELHRAGYHLGITHLHHFYTKRNYMVMYKLWKKAEMYSKEIADALKLLLLSYNATHCTLMTRVVAKKNAKDFVLTGAQSGVLYISKLPVEKNIFLGLKRKSKSFYDAYKLLEGCTGKVYVNNSSSTKLEIDSNSIDFIFTDPPFGDFIPYAEVNQINELWLSKVTDRKDEIIISSSQCKDVIEYKNMLSQVFSEITRVLKNKHYAAVVFHAAKAEVWRSFESAVINAGLTVSKTNILDKKQGSFKQVVSQDSVQGDPLLLLEIAGEQEKDEMSDQHVLDLVIDECSKQGVKDERRIYSLYITKCLERGIKVTLDAKEAYAYLKKGKGNNDE